MNGELPEGMISLEIITKNFMIFKDAQDLYNIFSRKRDEIIEKVH